VTKAWSVAGIEQIAKSLFSVFNPDLCAWMLSGFFIVERKLSRLESVLNFPCVGDSHSTGAKLLKYGFFVSQSPSGCSRARSSGGKNRVHQYHRHP
jgi:hypothetical protein